ncbi:PucR family transcriptional regulator [Rhodococcoides fascians]|uniref:PucR family transcriptional regulator n=1 Tax=Rhodococcoides fascians TaxID=1828 RepID=UPI0020D27A2B|nr:PucR family transcriptional regulator [Rhodococcus fascians]
MRGDDIRLIFGRPNLEEDVRLVQAKVPRLNGMDRIQTRSDNGVSARHRMCRLAEEVLIALTVRRLSDIQALGATLVAGLAEANRLIQWAHAIELADPTPWLNGGELVMTTGLEIGATDEAQFQYVSRLAQAGTAALALDTGTRFPAVPRGILAAGDDLGLPILSIPASTPFIAITRAVIEELTKDQLRITQRVVDQQENLAKATLKGGVTATVSALSRVIGASTAVIDVAGQVLASHGNSAHWAVEHARSVADSARAGFGRRGSIGTTMQDSHGYCTVQSVTAFKSVRAYLSVLCREALPTPDRLLVAHTVSLLSIELAKPAKVMDVENNLRSTVTSAMISLGDKFDVNILRYFGVDPTDDVAALHFANVGPLLNAEIEANACLSVITVPFLMTQTENELVVIVPSSQSEDVGRNLREHLNTQLGRDVRVGEGNPATLGDVARSLREASMAVRSSTTEPVTRFKDVGPAAFLLNSQQPAELRALARAMLRELDDHDARSTSGGVLLTTLRVFLEHNGEREAAATVLGVHRHTMRNRLAKIGDLIGRDLESAQVRADLWLALKARELATPISEL